MASGMTLPRSAFALHFDKVAGHATSLTLSGIAAEDELIAALSIDNSVVTNRLSALTPAAGAITTSADLSAAEGVFLLWNDLSAAGRCAIKPNVLVVAGADVNTDIAVAGIKTTDTLIGVIEVVVTTSASNDKKAVTTITSDGNIQISTGDTTGNKLIVVWTDNTAAAFGSGVIKSAVLTGAGANTNIAVTGIVTSDVIIGGIVFAAAGAVTSPTFTITSNGNIQSTTSTASASIWLLYWDTSG